MPVVPALPLRIPFLPIPPCCHSPCRPYPALLPNGGHFGTTETLGFWRDGGEGGPSRRKSGLSRRKDGFGGRRLLFVAFSGDPSDSAAVRLPNHPTMPHFPYSDHPINKTPLETTDALGIGGSGMRRLARREKREIPNQRGIESAAPSFGRSLVANGGRAVHCARPSIVLHPFLLLRRFRVA